MNSCPAISVGHPITNSPHLKVSPVGIVTGIIGDSREGTNFYLSTIPGAIKKWLAPELNNTIIR